MRFFEFVDIKLDEAPLGTTGLFKYKGTKKDRVPVFLRKIEQGTPFKVKTKAGFIDIVIDPVEFERVKQWIENPTSNLKLKTTDTTYPIIPFGAILKTKEFGGEEAGQREKIEQGQIGEIQSQLEDAKAGQLSVKLKVGDTVVNVGSVEKEKGSVNGRAPKSDMTVLDPDGTPRAWVSLKGEPFRWGGWQHLMNMPEIKQWMDRIKQVNGGTFKEGMSFGLHISSDVANKIVFGKEFGGKRGFSNVDAVLIGEATITNGKMSATRMYANGQTPTGPDQPYLVMRFMNGRNDVGFKNVRAETNTTSEGRKVKWLDSDADVQSAIKMFSSEDEEKTKLSSMTDKEKKVYRKEKRLSSQPPVPAAPVSVPPSKNTTAMQGTSMVSSPKPEPQF
jgi:hypothetical protein